MPEQKRNLRPEMLAFLDAALASNELAQQFIAEKNFRLLSVEASKACVGKVIEATGKNDGYLVNLMQDTVGSIANEYWCMSARQTILAYAEIKTGLSSPLPATEHCLTLWRWVKKFRPDLIVKRVPLPGAWAIWDRGNDTGHVEEIIAADEEMFFATGGNTSGSTVFPKGALKVDRNGNGYFYTKRLRREIIGFIKPI